MARMNLTGEIAVSVENPTADESEASIAVDAGPDASPRRQTHHISGTPQALYALAMGILEGLDPNHHRLREIRPRGRVQRPVPAVTVPAADELPPE